MNKGRHQGHTRHDRLSALRSLLIWAKCNKAVFHNPAARIRLGRRERPPLQPLTPEKIRSTIAAAATLPAKLYIALAAIRAARPDRIRSLGVGDVDLSTRRVTIGGRQRSPDDLTCPLLEQWLAYRREHWPHTANPHLLISTESALGLGPVSHAYVTDLRRAGLTLEQLRIDRRLAEALTSGGDPALFLAVFGGSETTAIRYAANARILLQPPHETAPAAPPRTPGPILDNEPGRP
ncbi:hypothetical protein [Streptomyces noursei]|uniref:hypothetical protein n=1 Tax=Streptomyces noursei TaxID=1971 RepID=UPI00196305CD|nr:hypothetical protein [Streptomyces noursei]QRX91134.1 hypothetical protein JNO44_10055 [Streptomyces noursei]